MINPIADRTLGLYVGHAPSDVMGLHYIEVAVDQYTSMIVLPLEQWMKQWSQSGHKVVEIGG